MGKIISLHFEPSSYSIIELFYIVLRNNGNHNFEFMS